MARTDNLINFLTDVADSIRSKTNKTDMIKPENYDTEIMSITTGGSGETSGSVIVDGMRLGWSVSLPDNLDTSRVTDMTCMFYDARTLTSIPQLDTSNVTNMEQMFNNCYALTSIPQLDTSNVTNMNRMFYNCNVLTSIQQLITSNVKDMEHMFGNCYALTSIPQLDTSNVTNMSRMFFQAKKLASIPQLDTSNVINMSNMFYNCNALTSIPQLDASKVDNISSVLYNCNNLTDFGGFKNLGKGFTVGRANYSNYALRISYSPNITYKSLMNVINNLYDLNLTYGVAGGGTLYRQKIVLGDTNLAKLSSNDIAIATNKGWDITAS